MARPKKVIDYKLVEELAGIFCTQKEISGIIDVSTRTMQKDAEFLRIYKKGQENAKMSLRRKQFKLADTNAGMAIFLGKNYLDQADKTEIENRHKIDGPEIASALRESDTNTD